MNQATARHSETPIIKVPEIFFSGEMIIGKTGARFASMIHPRWRVPHESGCKLAFPDQPETKQETIRFGGFSAPATLFGIAMSIVGIQRTAIPVEEFSTYIAWKLVTHELTLTLPQLDQAIEAMQRKENKKAFNDINGNVFAFVRITDEHDPVVVARLHKKGANRIECGGYLSLGSPCTWMVVNRFWVPARS